MNWLIYISGWVIGWAFFNGLIQNGNDNFNVIVKIIVWTMVWIWICWRFIS